MGENAAVIRGIPYVRELDERRGKAGTIRGGPGSG
jgi:hypothetical protein